MSYADYPNSIEREITARSRGHLERVVRSDFPRIVTNGRWYRVEISSGKYDMECGDFGACWIWETRFLWRARRRLRTVEKDEHEAETRKPERWKPVASNAKLTDTGGEERKESRQ